MSSYELGQWAGRFLIAAFVIALVGKLLGIGGAKTDATPLQTPGSTRFKADPEEGEQGGRARIVGAVMLAAGILLLFAAQFAMRVWGAEFVERVPGLRGSAWLGGFWALRVVAAMAPAIAGVGLARLGAGGVRALRMGLGVALALAGLAAGGLFAAGMEPSQKGAERGMFAGPVDAVHGTMARWMDAVTGALGLTRPVVGRADLDAALADLRVKAAAITQSRLTMNRSDKAAADALQKQIEAYNARQAVVTKMYDDYMSGLEGSLGLHKQVVGKWKLVESRADGAVDTTTAEYKEDGSVDTAVLREFPPKPEPGRTPELNGGTDQEASVAMQLAGTWTMNGRTLTIRRASQEIPQFGMTGDETMTVESVDENSMTVTKGKDKQVWSKVK